MFDRPRAQIGGKAETQLVTVQFDVLQRDRAAIDRNRPTHHLKRLIQRHGIGLNGDLRGAATSQSADTVQLALGGSTVTSMALHADTIVGSSGRTFYRRWAVSAGPFASTRNVQLRISPDIDDRMMPAKVDLYTMILLY